MSQIFFSRKFTALISEIQIFFSEYYPPSPSSAIIYWIKQLIN